MPPITRMPKPGQERLTPDNLVRQAQLDADGPYLIICHDAKVVIDGIDIAVERGFQEGAAHAKRATTSSHWPSWKAWTRTRAPSPLLRIPPESVGPGSGRCNK